MDDSLLRTRLERNALRYVGDSEPGIRRHKAGRGFCYRVDGTLVRDKAVLSRIKTLVIPPAWRDVWICVDDAGHIQATGLDQRGRKQYRYHPDWTAFRDAAKFENLPAFGEALPHLRAQVDADLRRHGLARERVLASVVQLLERTMIRVGSASYARQNNSFGLTTLTSDHLDVSGEKLRFDFLGKSGKQWKLTLEDRRIARVMKSIQDLPGQHLLQYRDKDGTRHAIDSSDVNAYIHAHAGPEFSSKDFRTWGGTVRALHELAERAVPNAKTPRRRALNAAIDAVAGKLGNTRAVCRRSYIHPRILTSWEADALAGELAMLTPPDHDGLDDEENLTLAWLERFASPQE